MFCCLQTCIVFHFMSIVPGRWQHNLFNLWQQFPNSSISFLSTFVRHSLLFTNTFSWLVSHFVSIVPDHAHHTLTVIIGKQSISKCSNLRHSSPPLMLLYCWQTYSRDKYDKHSWHCTMTHHFILFRTPCPIVCSKSIKYVTFRCSKHNMYKYIICSTNYVTSRWNDTIVHM